jgi:hypothetical protein
LQKLWLSYSYNRKTEQGSQELVSVCFLNNV